MFERWDVGFFIKGSRCQRDYCQGCGEPMRVDAAYDHITGDRIEHWCEECDPPKPPPPLEGLAYRQRSKLGHTNGG